MLGSYFRTWGGVQGVGGGKLGRGAPYGPKFLSLRVSSAPKAVSPRRDRNFRIVSQMPIRIDGLVCDSRA